MPYYCTVPRCTSMAGKAKNVSFHQFPKNEELADLWNSILKRGKPYTKYSKVCSLHFKPEDYTITSMGKNKGQWRSLRKDAVPSQNLPNEVPVQHQSHPRRSSTPVGAGLPMSPNLMDPKVQQQVAQAIYMQTMLAMQAAAYSGNDQRCSIDLSLKQNGTHDDESDSSDVSDAEHPVSSTDNHPPIQPQTSTSSEISELQRFLLKYSSPASNHPSTRPSTIQDIHIPPSNSYKCNVCSKFFKDPDVFLIHQRSHRHANSASVDPSNVQKENIFLNSDSTKTLRANPILANLLRPDDKSESLNVDKINSAMALNMEAYIKNITSYHRDSDSDSELSLNESKSPKLVIDESVQKSWL